MGSLHEAILHDKLDTIEECLQRGDDVNKKDGDGQTPLDLCAVTKGVVPHIPGINCSSIII